MLRNQPNAAGMQSMLLDDEKILPTWLGFGSGSNEVVKRNEMRGALKQSFQTINVWALPTPGTGAEPTDAGDARAAVEVSDGFKQAVGGLKACLAPQLQEPRVFNELELSASDILVFMDAVSRNAIQIVEACRLPFQAKPDGYKINLAPTLAFFCKRLRWSKPSSFTSALKVISTGTLTAGACVVAGAAALPGICLGAFVVATISSVRTIHYVREYNFMKDGDEEEKRRAKKEQK